MIMHSKDMHEPTMQGVQSGYTTPGVTGVPTLGEELAPRSRPRGTIRGPGGGGRRFLAFPVPMENGEG